MSNFIAILLTLFSIHFWGYLRLWRFKDLIDLISLSIMGVSMVNQMQMKNQGFKYAIILYLIGIVFNILSAYFNQGQGIKDTALSFGYFYFIIFYFWLHENKISTKTLENIILALAIIYVILNQIQINQFPHRIFHGTIFADRGTVRMRIQGAGFLVLGYFLLLNRYLLKRNLLSIILALIFLYVIIRGGSRTFAAGAVLLSGVVFLKLVKYSPVNYFLIVLAVILFLVMLQMQETSTVIRGMSETTEMQKQQGERYIRIMQWDYFTKEYPQNWSYYIFGGGLPGGYGSYANMMGYMVGTYGFFWVDLGLLGFYLVIGLIATVGLLWWVIKAIFTRLPPEYFYLNIYFAYLLIVSNIVMDEIFAPGIFGIQAIALYLIDSVRDKKTVSSTERDLKGRETEMTPSNS